MKHDWFIPGDEYPGLSKDYESCRKCGVVRQADGSSDTRPCKGIVRVTPR